MGMTYKMFCLDCQLSSGHIGKNRRIWDGEPIEMKKLKLFLMEHDDHPLRFAEDYFYDELCENTVYEGERLEDIKIVKR